PRARHLTVTARRSNRNMSLLQTINRLLRPAREPEADPAEAYDIWARSYDNQPENLILSLDLALCRELLASLPLAGKTIVDVGCGTGRHWPALTKESPTRLVGYDVSKGMLDRLRAKYPGAETRLLSGTALTGLDDSSCDLVFSTLTIAHLADLSAALAEWKRVLKPGGHLIITDYHPTALARGGQRTFRDEGRLIAVRSHIYPIPRLLAVAGRLGLTRVSLVEKKIDASMRPWYERQNALPVFHRFLGVPIIYGLHLTRRDATP
ncbi:MAG TPA: class I SAM-dependent methyltransferase, partial [Puia sp.]|nr:class I SAM-dependent methyltransferase [Puia sp.]